MAINILMPKLSFIVTEGTIIEWLKEPGDQVSKGEILLIIESEKATVEVESPGAGILGPDLAPVGTTVPVTTTIGYILEPGEEPPRLELDLVESVRDEPDAEPSPTEREGQRAEKRRKRSPSARRLAQEHGVDPAEIEGSGPQGRIVKQDVLAYMEARTRAEKKAPVRITPAARRLASALGVDLGQVEATGTGDRVTLEDVRRASQVMPVPPPAESLELFWMAEELDDLVDFLFGFLYARHVGKRNVGHLLGDEFMLRPPESAEHPPTARAF